MSRGWRRPGWGQREPGAVGRGDGPCRLSPVYLALGHFSAEGAVRQTPRPAAQLAADRPLHVPGKVPAVPQFPHLSNKV